MMSGGGSDIECTERGLIENRKQICLQGAANGLNCPICCKMQPEARISYLGRGCYRSLEFQYLDCSYCGSLFVHPMPDQAVLSEMYGPEYLDIHYATELNGGKSNSEAAQELDDAIRLLVSFKPSGRILDLGCGAGQFLIAANKAGFQPEGYEWRPATAELATNATGLKVHTGSLKELESRYDAVHLADVLEHCPDPLNVLLEARRLLAPGGILIVRGPLENQANVFQQGVRLHRLLRTRLMTLPPITLPPYHLILFARMGWQALIRRSGLAVLYERIYEVHWPVPERFRLSPLYVVKKLSLAVSRSPLGHLFCLGNRVCSVLGV